jgi:hypothetical protein
MIAGINLHSNGIRRGKGYILFKNGRDEEDVQGIEEYSSIPFYKLTP